MSRLAPPTRIHFGQRPTHDAIRAAKAEENAIARAVREAAEAQREKEYAESIEAINRALAEKDRARAKADGRHEDVAPDKALGIAQALIDQARLSPTDRDLTAKAMNAAARAGILARKPCDLCKTADAHPLPIPGRDVLDASQGWCCDGCARGHGGARF